MGAVPDPSPRSFAGLRILVVDDTEELAEILTFVLAREGAEVEVATDGPTAVARATGEAFDVVLMDVGLPGIDGLEACRRITAERDDVTVVMLSARDASADRAAGAAAGAAGYLSKPFTPRALVAQLRELLASADGPGHGGG
jgi:DNA-binding response OmpR family regulator